MAMRNDIGINIVHLKSLSPESATVQCMTNITDHLTTIIHTMAK